MSGAMRKAMGRVGAILGGTSGSPPSPNPSAAATQKSSTGAPPYIPPADPDPAPDPAPAPGPTASAQVMTDDVPPMPPEMPPYPQSPADPGGGIDFGADAQAEVIDLDDDFRHDMMMNLMGDLGSTIGGLGLTMEAMPGLMGTAIQEALDEAANAWGFGEPEMVLADPEIMAEVHQATLSDGDAAPFGPVIIHPDIVDIVGNIINWRAGYSGPPQTPFSLPVLTLEDVLNDKDTSGRFNLLRQYGINPLRAFILSTSEFLPIGTGPTEMYQDTINLSFGEESSVSVTQVARLIELHRLLRAATIQSADNLIDQYYPTLSSFAFLSDLKNKIKASFNDVFNTDRNVSIEGLCQNMITHLVSQSGATGDTFANTVLNFKSSPFLRALVEYYIYDEILLELIKYMEDIMNAKRVLAEGMKLVNLSVAYSSDSADTGGSGSTSNREDGASAAAAVRVTGRRYAAGAAFPRRI
jgi:hypothetical protein